MHCDGGDLVADVLCSADRPSDNAIITVNKLTDRKLSCAQFFRVETVTGEHGDNAAPDVLNPADNAFTERVHLPDHRYIYNVCQRFARSVAEAGFHGAQELRCRFRISLVAEVEKQRSLPVRELEHILRRQREVSEVDVIPSFFAPLLRKRRIFKIGRGRLRDLPARILVGVCKGAADLRFTAYRLGKLVPPCVLCCLVHCNPQCAVFEVCRFLICRLCNKVFLFRIRKLRDAVLRKYISFQPEGIRGGEEVPICCRYKPVPDFFALCDVLVACLGQRILPALILHIRNKAVDKAVHA